VEGEPFENTQSTWQTVRKYDSSPSASVFPWSQVPVENVNLNNTAGKLTARAHNSDGAWRIVLFSYDAEGRVKRKVVFTDASFGRTEIAYTYNRQGRVTERRVVVGNEDFNQWYEYNKRGHVKKVYASRSSEKPSQAIATYTYAADGQVKSTDWRGGPDIGRRYNARGWLTQVGTPGSPSGFAASYDYFPDGNLRASTADPEGRARFTRSYSYDGLDRLQSADYGDNGLTGAYDVSGLSYDRNGNIEALTRRGSGGGTVDALSYSYQGNRLTSLSDGAGQNFGWDAGGGSFQYDAAGRMLTAPAPTGLEAASYDEQGLPEAMQLSGGRTLTYRYTASGQRTYKQVGGESPTRYVRDGSALLAVVQGGSLKHWNVVMPGGETIGRVRSGGTHRYYIKDHLGSIRAVLDGSGNARATRDYYPFGLPMPGRHEKGSPPTKEDFTGHVKDDATGLHYAGARYYSSAFGRWTTTEPLLQSQSPRKLLKDGKGRLLSGSPYGYSLNNPTNLTDPDGRCPICDVADIAFAAQSVSTAVQDPSATNIGIATFDVAAAALPVVPSTGVVRNGIKAVRHGDEAIQAVKAGVQKGKRALDMAQASKALGRAANKAESVAGLKKVATNVQEIGGGLSVSLGTGSNASKIAQNLVGEGTEAVSKTSGVKVFEGVKLEGKTANVVVRSPEASSAGTATVQVQVMKGGKKVKDLKFRTQKAGELFE